MIEHMKRQTNKTMKLTFKRISKEMKNKHCQKADIKHRKNGEKNANEEGEEEYMLCICICTYLLFAFSPVWNGGRKRGPAVAWPRINCRISLD